MLLPHSREPQDRNNARADGMGGRQPYPDCSPFIFEVEVRLALAANHMTYNNVDCAQLRKDVMSDDRVLEGPSVPNSEQHWSVDIL